MYFTRSTGGDASSKSTAKRGELSHLRALLSPAIQDNQSVTMKWRNSEGVQMREEVKPLEWRGRKLLITECGQVIDLESIEEITQ